MKTIKSNTLFPYSESFDKDVLGGIIFLLFAVAAVPIFIVTGLIIMTGFESAIGSMAVKLEIYRKHANRYTKKCP